MTYPLEHHIWPLRVGGPVTHPVRATTALGLRDPHRPPRNQVCQAGCGNGDSGLPRLLAPAAEVQMVLCALLSTELGEPLQAPPS